MIFMMTVISLALVFFALLFVVYIKASDKAAKDIHDQELFNEFCEYAFRKYGPENVTCDHKKRSLVVHNEN